MLSFLPLSFKLLQLIAKSQLTSLSGVAQKNYFNILDKIVQKGKRMIDIFNRLNLDEICCEEMGYLIFPQPVYCQNNNVCCIMTGLQVGPSRSSCSVPVVYSFNSCFCIQRTTLQ